jgi:hypothetical protein
MVTRTLIVRIHKNLDAEIALVHDAQYQVLLNVSHSPRLNP